jgi:hypothetical protein
LKRPDLLTLVVAWQFISAFFSFLGLCALAIFAFPEIIGPMWGPALTGGIFGLSVAILMLLVLIGIAIAGGVGLLKGQEWGRVLSIVFAALNLFAFPFGTIIGVLILIYLTKPDVAAYFNNRNQPA